VKVGSKVLGVFAHPDDEVIFGWPIFQDPTLDRYLICCSWTDYRKDDRRLRALRAVCKSAGITLLGCLENERNFHKFHLYQPERDVYDRFYTLLYEVLNKIQPDYVFTHNPIGEYGHGSHKLVCRMMLACFQSTPLLFTDIVRRDMYYDYLSTGEFSEYWKRNLYSEQNKLEGPIQVDYEWFLKMREIYYSFDCPRFWKEPSQKNHTALYCLQKEQVRRIQRDGSIREHITIVGEAQARRPVVTEESPVVRERVST